MREGLTGQKKREGLTGQKKGQPEHQKYKQAYLKGQTLYSYWYTDTISFCGSLISHGKDRRHQYETEAPPTLGLSLVFSTTPDLWSYNIECKQVGI